MSNLRPSPMSTGETGPTRDRRVSWGNRRVREYLKNDIIEEDSDYASPRDTYEGPLESSSSSQSSPMLQAEAVKTPEREQSRDQAMLTPMRKSRSPMVRMRTSRIDKEKLTPMKTFGFSLSRVLSMKIPVTPQKPQPREEKYLLEARQQEKELDGRLGALIREKALLQAGLETAIQRVSDCRQRLAERTAELQRQQGVENLPACRVVLTQLELLADWVPGYLTEGEQVWHHASSFYNAPFYDLFHCRIRPNKVELYTSGDWPDSEVREEFKALWPRKQLLFQSQCNDLSATEVLERAADEVDQVVLFMKELWHVKVAFLVQDCQFTDLEMVVLVSREGELVQVRTDLGSLRSWVKGKSGSLTSLLTTY